VRAQFNTFEEGSYFDHDLGGYWRGDLEERSAASPSYGLARLRLFVPDVG
jgi:hypothetical protein